MNPLLVLTTVGTRADAEALARVLVEQRLAACAQAVLDEVPATMLARDSAGRLTDIAVDHGEFAHLDEATIAQVVVVMRRHGLTATHVDLLDLLFAPAPVPADPPRGVVEQAVERFGEDLNPVPALDTEGGGDPPHDH